MRTIYGSIAGGIKYVGSFADGRVGCCCIACCMYPSRDTTPSDAYTFDDLPETLDITLDDVLYEGATKEDVGGGVWRYVHPDYEGGTVPLIRTELGNGWFFGDDGGLGSSGCLVAEIDGGATKAEDTFPGILQADWNSNAPGANDDSAVLTRVSLCEWTGTSNVYGAAVRLFYDPALYIWTINITWPTPVPGYSGTFPRTGGSSLDASSGQNQSTPVNTYFNLGGWDFTPADGNVGVFVT